MRYFILLALIIFSFFACLKEEEDVIEGNESFGVLDEVGKGLTERLLSAKQRYDSLHSPAVVDSSCLLEGAEDTIVPGELFCGGGRKVKRELVREDEIAGSTASYYYDYYYGVKRARSRELIKSVTAIYDVGDTVFTVHRYGFSSGDIIAADTMITWGSFEASGDTSVTVYY